MKTIKFIFPAMLTVLGQISFAQTGQWKLAGNSLSGAPKLGSTNSAALNFITNNKPRMTITPAGFVGIGTSAPDASLHVLKGSAGAVSGRFDAPLVVENSTNSYMNLLSPNANESGVLFGNPLSNVDGGIIYNNFANPGGLQFRTTSNFTRMVLTSAGNLGIGTLTPDATLHVFKGSAGNVSAFFDAPLVVENSTNSYVNLLSPGADESGVLFGNPSSNVDGGIIYNNQDNPGGLQFRTSGNNTSMTLSANGKLGVGANPGFFKLKVSQNDGFGLNIANTTDAVSDWELFTSNNLMLFGNGTFKGSFSQVDGTYSSFSDERLKTNIKPMLSVLEKINQLKPSTYQFKNSGDHQEHDGFIAQDIMKVFPALVTHNVNTKRNLDVYTLNYSGFGVIAVKAIQELQTIIQSQKSDIDEMKAMISELKTRMDQMSQKTSLTINASSQNNKAVELSGARLIQNAPNPFNTATVISYYLPEIKGSASIEIVSSNGQLLKTYPVTQKGNGQLSIKAGELASGTYNYVLIIDSKKVDSKQMVLVK